MYQKISLNVSFAQIRKAIYCSVWMASVFFVVLPVTAANAEVFRWVDAEGNVHYGDKASAAQSSKGQQVELHDNAADASSEVGEKNAAPTVTLYSTVWCGYCRKAKRLFERRSVAYTEHDIEADAEAKRNYDRLGGRGVPFIVIGDRTIAGYSRKRIIHALEQAGL